jgi:hypothetical protein
LPIIRKILPDAKAPVKLARAEHAVMLMLIRTREKNVLQKPVELLPVQMDTVMVLGRATHLVARRLSLVIATANPMDMEILVALLHFAALVVPSRE